ncbi:MAG: SIS domain-containing protein [Candidatus Omnitrophica bacterium]|nr:SIS domain-containing protein [Candidatus Omnitrophota bacterium]MBU1047406.1 SIS domain-containing protein [Candidatus Omnitrophota bacterium]MBU1630207.1 SIS domain-containing protein [Candidatus Omnitrophota bacterium]MBU1888770.1 SIS domain-containing protein [Candidatus Omnitrophota bacterium]
MSVEVEKLCKRHPDLIACKKDIESAIDTVKECYKNNNKVLTCGNGGSAADAEHIVGELMKGSRKKRKVSSVFSEKIKGFYPQECKQLCDNLQIPLPAISLTSHLSFTTAFNNDMNPEFTFTQQLFGLGKEGDVLIALSTSGNAKNVINACKLAKVLGIKTIALTGKDGGTLKDICDIVIRVPEEETFLVQEYHLPIYHAICSAIENEFFEK